MIDTELLNLAKESRVKAISECQKASGLSLSDSTTYIDNLLKADSSTNNTSNASENRVVITKGSQKMNNGQRMLLLIGGIILACFVVIGIAIAAVEMSPDTTTTKYSGSSSSSSSSLGSSYETTSSYNSSNSTTTNSGSSSSGTYYTDCDPDEWYISKTYSPLKVMNCAIQSATPLADSNSVSVMYYPVCTSCHYANTNSIPKMNFVSPDDPEIYNYYCNNCGAVSVVRLQIIY